MTQRPADPAPATRAYWCTNCNHRPAVHEGRCRTCLVIGKSLDPPRIELGAKPVPKRPDRKRQTMRDWQAPLDGDKP